MPRGELRGAETGFLFHEVLLNEIAVGDEGFRERKNDDALWKV
jgi:hypothetical protein